MGRVRTGHGALEAGGGVTKGSAKASKARMAAVTARIAAELSKEAFGEGSGSWADEMDTDATDPGEGVNPFTAAHSAPAESQGGMAETPKPSRCGQQPDTQLPDWTNPGTH
jgi:hypothetical protein